MLTAFDYSTYGTILYFTHIALYSICIMSKVRP